jgi:hypothetical protein
VQKKGRLDGGFSQYLGFEGQREGAAGASSADCSSDGRLFSELALEVRRVNYRFGGPVVAKY